MTIESEGILIKLSPLSERDMIARIFTKNTGLLSGVLRGAVSAKKNKPLVAQFGKMSWNARLDSQLGVFHWESEYNLSVNLIMNPDLLKIMNSVFALIDSLIPERESYEQLYNDTVSLLKSLSQTNNPYDLYLKWEIQLLQELGYGLDITKCSGCGKSEDLCFLSPKTGRAVCSVCGEPYKSKLYNLPISLSVTKKFISHICDVQGINMPFARNMF